MTEQIDKATITGGFRRALSDVLRSLRHQTHLGTNPKSPDYRLSRKERETSELFPRQQSGRRSRDISAKRCRAGRTSKKNRTLGVCVFQSGADVNVSAGGAHRGNRPLHHACLNGHLPSVEVLLDFGQCCNVLFRQPSARVCCVGVLCRVLTLE